MAALGKFIIGIILGLVLLLLATAGFIIGLVAIQPRQIPALSTFIENAIHAENIPYSIKVGETWLVWENWRHPLDIQLRNVTVLTEQGQVFAGFPEISIGLDWLSLPRGQILPRSITLNHPIISLIQNEDRSINFGFRSEHSTESTFIPSEPGSDGETPAELTPEELANTTPFTAALAPLLHPADHGILSKLRFITIHNANLSIRNRKTGVTFQARHVDFSAKRRRESTVSLNVGGHVIYGSYQSTISANLELAPDKPTIDVSLEFQGIEPSRLAAFFSNDPVFGIVKLPLSGTASGELDQSGILQRMQFAVESGIGEIHAEQLATPLPVKWAHIEGQLSNNASDIQIDTLRANIDDMLVGGNGVASFSDGDAAIRANVAIRNITASKIPMLWPPTLSPISREWVTTNITEGIVPEAAARINIQFGDRKKPAFPKESVDAEIALENATIRYLPDHPEIRNAQGKVHIDGVSLHADITTANYLNNTKLSNGTLVIDDLNADNPYITLNFNADATAKDIVHVLGLPRLKHTQHLGLKENAVEGTVKGKAVLGFHFFAPPQETTDSQGDSSDIRYDIEAEVSGFSQLDFMKKFDIKDAQGTLAVNNTGILYKGGGQVNGAQVENAEVKYLFSPEDGLDTFISIQSANVPTSTLPRFGYPAFPFIEGVLGVKGSLKQGENTEISEATIDLTNAIVRAPEINWLKPEKDPASLTITAEKRNGVSAITTLHLKGKNVNAQGSAELTGDFSALRRLTLTTCNIGETELSHLRYETRTDGYSLEATGKSIDLSGIMNSQNSHKARFSFEHFPTVEFKGDIEHVLFGKDRSVRNLKGELHCDTTRCGNADISGNSGKPFNFRILRNPKGQRQISLHAEDAGSFLKALDIYDTMEGGDLSLTGNYDDKKPGTLKGRFDIRSYTLKNAPILAKILSLASLTGFFDTLQGKGIAFDRLAVPFTLNNDVITISKAKMYGSAIGMTIDGTMTMPQAELNLHGAIVPSYTLNSMAGKIPLVGPILTGGSDGQGVFAARYTVTGVENKPNVSVNPLSILTPGFLRGFFDIFDQTEKKPQ